MVTIDPPVSSPWLRIKAVARRHSYVLMRAPHRMFDVTLWPVVDVLLFGALATYVDRADGNVANSAAGYLLAGIVLWHVIYQSQIAQSTGFLEETWTRNLLNVMVTPVRDAEYMAGVALFGLVKLAMGITLMVVGAFVFFSFDTTSLGPGIIPIAIVLLAVGWVISLFVIGLILRFGTGAEALAWGVMFVLLPLSGIFYPVDALPTFLQPIAEILPTTHAFEALRVLVDGAPLDWAQVGIAAASTVAFGIVAIWYCTRMLRLFRARGYVTRHL